MALLTRLLVLAALAVLLPAWGQAPEATAPLLRLSSPTAREVYVSATQWAALPRSSVTAIDHNGTQATFEGVPAAEVLKLIDAPLGGALRGKNMAWYVLAEGADGYRAVYALAEFDAGYTDRILLIADRRDGRPLASEEGRLRMVVPGEQRQARWVRQLVALRLGYAE